MIDHNLKKEIDQRVSELDKLLSADEAHIVAVYNHFRQLEGNTEKSDRSSLHATLGAHNSDFADVKHRAFSSVEEYIVTWLQGLERVYGDRKDLNTGNKTYIIFRLLLEDDKCQNYVLNFQRRTFYKNFEAYSRVKPKEQLETVWFGDNQNCWGLPIAPVLREGKYENDHSEIRRVSFHYWTLEHILSTGLINYSKKNILKFYDLSGVSGFFQRFPEQSHSPFEPVFLKKYFDYVSRSDNWMKEPLLIPEFRFGEDKYWHRWRTDFLILNSYTNTHVAIELSPKSTHKDWEREMKKRSDYLKKYNISIITFTDYELQSIGSCFERVIPYLQKPKNNKESISIILNRFKQN